ncbi:uncharacterized protein LOC129729974 isoform X2 [Wyeomyia smithii]|uniref:uncharacterized protein LOC129729974 isoform X2 n=1 Tax=Wyeomyia smithii TaxID=174621 RepID=UPI002467F522|nr:uncharacterized protein LOC129729974 isoform X2 [Wyeomyia smithii]
MKFLLATLLLAALLLETVPQTASRAADDGKYSKRKYINGNHGKYRHTNEGDYVEDLDRYRYVHYDDGDRGRYIHVHIPYDGGYGNYEGGHEPFRNPPYDATGLYADSNVGSGPFRSNEYDIKKPSLYLEYGTPYPELNYGASTHRIKQTAPSAELDPRVSNFPATGYLPALKTPSDPSNPNELVTKQRKQVSPLSIEIDALPPLTSPRTDDTKIRLITEVSGTIFSSTTEQSTSPVSFASLSSARETTTKQQLQQCRAELEESQQKLSRCAT